MLMSSSLRPFVRSGVAAPVQLAVNLLLQYCPAALAARPWELIREVSRYAESVDDVRLVERYCTTLAQPGR